MEPSLKEIISSIPSIDLLLRDTKGTELQEEFGRKIVKSNLRLLISQMQEEIKLGELQSVCKEDIYVRLRRICMGTSPEIKEKF